LATEDQIQWPSTLNVGCDSIVTLADEQQFQKEFDFGPTLVPRNIGHSTKTDSPYSDKINRVFEDVTIVSTMFGDLMTKDGMAYNVDIMPNVSSSTSKVNTNT